MASGEGPTENSQSSQAPPQGENLRWVRLRWLSGDIVEAPLFGHRHPIDSVIHFFLMADEGDIPGIPSATVRGCGSIGHYELIWNGEVVEEHIRLVDLGIQDDDELMGGNVRWVRLRWSGGDTVEGPLCHRRAWLRS